MIPKFIKITITSLIFIFFGLSISQAENGTKIENHPLKNKTARTPEYYMVLKDIKTKDMHLIGFSQKASSFGSSFNGMELVEIIEPNTDFKVVEVYKSPLNILNGYYQFAILEKNGKKYIRGPVDYGVFWQDPNYCNKTDFYSICYPYVQAIKECLTKFKGKNCTVSYGLSLLNKDGLKVYDKTLRPPYPDGFIEKTQSAFVKYQKSRPNLEIILTKDHPTIDAKLTDIELINTFLHYEELNIETVSTLNFGGDGSWEKYQAQIY